MGFLDLFRGRPVLLRGAGKVPEGHAKKVELGDSRDGDEKQIVLCRIDGVLYALDSKCPHEGGRIGEGPLAGGKLATCPLHNFQFDPRSGASVGSLCDDARTYRVQEKDGDCEIWV